MLKEGAEVDLTSVVHAGSENLSANVHDYGIAQPTNARLRKRAGWRRSAATD